MVRLSGTSSSARRIPTWKRGYDSDDDLQSPLPAGQFPQSPVPELSHDSYVQPEYSRPRKGAVANERLDENPSRRLETGVVEGTAECIAVVGVGAWHRPMRHDDHVCCTLQVSLCGLYLCMSCWRSLANVKRQILTIDS